MESKGKEEKEKWDRPYPMSETCHKPGYDKQTTSQLLMVRPVCFAFNEQTASNNAFQQRSDAGTLLQQQAVEEFDAYVALLRQHGVRVTVAEDTPQPPTPDSIFPNNCFSTHSDATGRTLVLYPMFAPNRRDEREKLRPLLMQMPFDRVLDLTHWEKEGHFLEGTGSLILDRERHVAYACRSPRTHEEVVADWARQMDYDYVLFDSVDDRGTPVYHTNVVMHVGTHTAVVCLDSINDDGQRSALLRHLEASGKEVVPITMSQVRQFAGNMLEVQNTCGEQLLVMSATARQSLSPAQLSVLTRHTHIVAPDLHIIEKAGGGSARCMIAEIYPTTTIYKYNTEILRHKEK